MSIADLVVEEINKRKAAGIVTYGIPLEAFNGRNSLQDAVEESLDMAHYLMQAKLEREEMINVLQYYSKGEEGQKALSLLEKLGEE